VYPTYPLLVFVVSFPAVDEMNGLHMTGIKAVESKSPGSLSFHRNMRLRGKYIPSPDLNPELTNTLREGEKKTVQPEPGDKNDDASTDASNNKNTSASEEDDSVESKSTPSEASKNQAPDVENEDTSREDEGDTPLGEVDSPLMANVANSQTSRPIPRHIPIQSARIGKTYPAQSRYDDENWESTRELVAFAPWFDRAAIEHGDCHNHKIG